MTTNTKNELRLPTQDERENAMNEIAIMFCENKRLSYGEIRSKFDFVVSDILLEFELSGLIVQLPGQQFVLVEEEEVVVEEVVVEVEREENTVEETITSDVGLQNAYNDYKNKLAKARKWFEFEPSEYIGDTVHDKIIVWDKKVYYSCHPAFKPGDKFSSHIMNRIAYTKRRKPDEGRRKLVKF
jgi:hypothetical protein